MIEVDSLIEWSDAHNAPGDFREKAVLLYGKGNGTALVDAGDSLVILYHQYTVSIKAALFDNTT